MTDTEAIEILRAQGHAVGAPDYKLGTVRVWMRGSDDYVDVKLGRDLIRLAEGGASREVAEKDFRQAGSTG